MSRSIGVQQMMQEMEKMQEKGEVDEAELRALEEDVTGKIMLASWRGTRFGVNNVLREVRTAVRRLMRHLTVNHHRRSSIRF